MSETADLLLRAVASALAGDRRVLVFGDSFELLELLAAAPVKELVIVSSLADPDAPAGSTVHGAPLRMRPDWAERPSSKDLVVDARGDAPPDQVARVLKKAGIYLAATPTPALAALPEQRAVTSAFAPALVVGEGGPLVAFAGGEDAGPTVYLGGTLPPPEAAVVGLLPAGLAPAGARLAEVEADLAATRAELAAQGEALEGAMALGQRALELEDAAAASERALAAAQQADAATRARADRLQAELSELETTYQQVRDELAQRRVADRRAEAVRTRFEAARAEMASELAELRAQVRALGEPAQDATAVLAERDAARAAYDAAVEALAACLGALGTTPPSPPPAYVDAAARDAWLLAARERLVQAGAEVAALRVGRVELEAEIGELVQAVRQRDELLAALQAPAAAAAAPAAPASVAADASALEEKAEALEGALAAERRARQAEARAHREQVQAAEAVLADRQRLLTELADARQAAARARLAGVSGEEDRRRLTAERGLRDQRIGDLEAMMATHARMHTLLAEALADAEAARDEAEAGRRLVEANLRLLQAELDRRDD